jgi:hypothetical protein
MPSRHADTLSARAWKLAYACVEQASAEQASPQRNTVLVVFSIAGTCTVCTISVCNAGSELES